jgi:hypothetical protein
LPTPNGPRKTRSSAHFRDQLLDPLQSGARVVRVNRADPAGMASVPRLQERQRFTAADLADNYAVRPQAHRRLQQPLHVDSIGCAHHYRVFGGALDLGRVFDNDQPMPGRGAHNMVDNAVCERRFAGAGAADHEDVVPQGDRRLDRPALPRRHDSLLFIIVQREHRGGLAANREHRGRYDGRDQRLEAGAVAMKDLPLPAASCRRSPRLSKAVDPDRAVGVEHRLDDIRFV